MIEFPTKSKMVGIVLLIIYIRGWWLAPIKGFSMTFFQSLVLMISFGTLIVAILSLIAEKMKGNINYIPIKKTKINFMEIKVLRLFSFLPKPYH